MKNIKLFGLLLLSAMPVFGKFHQVSSLKSFQRLIERYPYTVVCFDQSRPEKGQTVDKDSKQEMKSSYKKVRRGVKAASQKSDYKNYLNKDVGFLMIDTTSGRAEEIDDIYAIEQLPICLLFKNGKAISHRAAYAQIFDPITKASVLGLIDQYWENELDDLIDNKKEEEEERRKERLLYDRFAYGPYGYWGWGYPSYYWGYPYRGWGYRTWC